jgi:hypothetical protein
MMIRRIAFVLSAAVCAATSAQAQQQPQPFGPSVEASAGLFLGGGGTFHQRGGPTIDAVVAVPLARAGRGTVVAGVTGGISGPLAYDLVCLDGPNDECIPSYPTFASIGAVAGVQRALGSATSARALAGAGFYQDIDGPGTVGLQGRLDVAQRLIFRTALVASVRGAVLPSYEGQSLSFAAFGLGIRIQ